MKHIFIYKTSENNDLKLYSVKKRIVFLGFRLEATALEMMSNFENNFKAYTILDKDHKNDKKEKLVSLRSNIFWT